jgi:hypothetical protein
MITAQLNGGMGNAMFQYAFAYACAQRLKTKFQLDTSLLGGKRKYVLDQWLIFEPTVTGVAPTIHEPGDMHYSQELVDRVKDGDCLQGYWQSEKYFYEYASEIRAIFVPRTNLQYTIKEPLLQRNSIAVHVRRDDYLLSPHKEFHGLLDMDYYTTAMDYIRKKVDKPTFYVFSEDIKWVKENFTGQDVNAVDPNSESDDIYLMSLCNHAIIANSSFSWWSGFLGENVWNSDRIVIAPREWFKDSRTSYQDLVPERWVRI